jgi:hypothetical protein
MQQRTNQVLYAYWNDVRGERIAPRRFDVEPSQLGSVLSETFILECGAGQAPAFRLAGTKICDSFGREFRGLEFLDVFRPEDREAITQQLADVQAQGAVLVLNASVALDVRAIVAIDAPGWLGSVRLPALEVTATQQVWPDGRPHAVAEKFRSAPALVPELAGARLVRVNRRSFRVLDGGLAKG